MIITCAIAEPNGNYDVHVELGSASAAANSRVLAETYRIEQPPTATAMKAFVQQTFTVNVRQEVHDGYGAVGGILNLMIDGSAPAFGRPTSVQQDPARPWHRTGT